MEILVGIMQPYIYSSKLSNMCLIMRVRSGFSLVESSACVSVLHTIDMQLFQLRLSQSKAEKSNTCATDLLGIANELMEFITDFQQAVRAYIRLFRFAWDNLNWNSSKFLWATCSYSFGMRLALSIESDESWRLWEQSEPQNRKES